MGLFTKDSPFNVSFVYTHIYYLWQNFQLGFLGVWGLHLQLIQDDLVLLKVINRKKLKRLPLTNECLTLGE